MLSVRGPTGRIMYVDRSDERASELVRAGGDHNPGALCLWRTLVERHDWDLVIDVGANYGEMLVNVELPSSSTTLALEPNPFVAEYLARTLRESDQAIELLLLAASDRNGTSEFLVDLEWSGKSGIDSTTAGPNTRILRVPTRRLDDLVLARQGARKGPSDVLVKIDVEGHEARVLAGLAATAGAGGVVACMVEITHMDGSTLAALGETYDVYVHRTETNEFVRLDVRVEDVPTALARAQGAYPHDAVLIAKAGPGDLV